MRNLLEKVAFCDEISNRDGENGTTTMTLVGPIILLLMVKTLHFPSFGRTNNCEVKDLLKSLNQYHTLSTAREQWDKMSLTRLLMNNLGTRHGKDIQYFAKL